MQKHKKTHSKHTNQKHLNRKGTNAVGKSAKPVLYWEMSAACVGNDLSMF